uniref:glycosyltransferase family 4 protein n=1 Tax=Nonomuraea pusilla TaxID=46177 RepID=UPI0006E183C6|nr:MraY family glycosyltransferase [Nonomuraea pusilla]
MSAATAVAAGAGASLICGLTIVPLRRLALRWGMTDRPGAKKAHARPTPYVGGIAIALGTLVPAVAVLGFADIRITAILMAAAIVALLGLIDDIRPLPPVTRLVVETVAATGVVLSGVHVHLAGDWLDLPLTVVWIVVMANSFNLLDNMDGVLGAVATVTAAFLAIMAFAAGEPALALLLVMLTCAGIGFLPHNWAPAKTFMGDSGSLFIGFVLTCSAVFLISGHTWDTVAAGLLLPTFVATVDTGVVFLSRLRAGRSPLLGGTDHVSHRMRKIGLSVRLVASALGLMAAAACGLCVTMTLGWMPPLAVTIIAAGTAFVLVTLFQSVKVYPPATPRKTSPRIRERRR